MVGVVGGGLFLGELHDSCFLCKRQGERYATSDSCRGWQDGVTVGHDYPYITMPGFSCGRAVNVDC